MVYNQQCDDVLKSHLCLGSGVTLLKYVDGIYLSNLCGVKSKTIKSEQPTTGSHFT